jgi:tripartite-type tricarboxylate transporter receptor subunit TctC
MMIRIAICLVSVLVAGNASAQHVRMILPVSAGSGVDTIARAVAPALSKTIGAQVVIENLPGAGGVTGTAAIVKAPANGQTIGLVSNNHVINPSVYPKMPFDSIEDVTPISVLGTTPLVLVVHPKVPAKDVGELIALAKARPGAYNYASSGNGTIIHLAGEMFVREAGIEVKHIPYKGTSPMLQDLVGGQVEMGVVALPAVQGHLRSGALRAIGITGRQRAPAAKDIPTVAEQGLPNYDVEGWFAVVGPAKLPAAEVNRIHGAFVAAFAVPEVQETMTKQGNVIKPTSPPEAAQMFRAELAKYAKVVKAAGVKID